jgi:hypothetical protein
MPAPYRRTYRRDRQTFDTVDGDNFRNTQGFRDPGGRSALRSGSRIHPCPTCGRPEMLTDADVAKHYQCDYCADAAEGLGWGF